MPCDPLPHAAAAMGPHVMGCHQTVSQSKLSLPSHKLISKVTYHSNMEIP